MCFMGAFRFGAHDQAPSLAPPVGAGEDAFRVVGFGRRTRRVIGEARAALVREAHPAVGGSIEADHRPITVGVDFTGRLARVAVRRSAASAHAQSESKGETQSHSRRPSTFGRLPDRHDLPFRCRFSRENIYCVLFVNSDQSAAVSSSTTGSVAGRSRSTALATASAAVFPRLSMRSLASSPSSRSP